MRILRFTLSHEPIPKLSLFKDTGGVDNAWSTLGENPTIAITGAGQSNILNSSMVVEEGKVYVFNLSYVAVLTDGTYLFQVFFYNNTTQLDAISFPVLNGTHSDTGNFTAPATANKVAFRITQSVAGTHINFTLKSLTAPNVFVVSEPEGWKTAICGFERHPEFFSLVEFYKSEFSFYGSNGTEDGGRDSIKSIETLYGPDAQIDTLLETADDLILEWRTFFKGSLPLIMIIEAIDLDHTLKIPFTQTGFWTKFISRFESSVDVRSTTDLDGGIVEVKDTKLLKLSSQKIRQTYSGYINNRTFLRNFNLNDYHSLEFDKEPVDEITEKYNYPMESNGTEVPVSKFIMEFDGEYQFDYSQITAHASGSIIIANMGSTIPFLKIFLQVNQDPAIEFLSTDRLVVDSGLCNDGTTPFSFNDYVTDYELSYLVNLKKNDAVRIYLFYYAAGAGNMELFGINGDSKIGSTSFQGYHDASTGLFPSVSSTGGGVTTSMSWIIAIPGTLDGVPVLKDYSIKPYINTPGQIAANWYINALGFTEGLFKYGETKGAVTAGTLFAATEVDAYLQHDIAASVIERIVGQKDSIHAPYLGSPITTAKTYSSYGAASNYVGIKGLHLRGYTFTEKLFSLSMRDIVEGINPIFNTGIGYDVVNGKDVIFIGQKKDFVDDSSMSTILYNVRKIKRLYEKEDFYFNQVELGFDKWNSDGVLGIDDPQTKRKWATIFKNIGRPFEMLSKWIGSGLTIERARRENIKKSKDYQYDNDTFIVEVVPDGSDLKPALDEKFSSVTNLYYEDTRYNKSITAARNLLRWTDYIFSCLQNYLYSSLTFVSGEGNYNMASTMTANGSPEDFGGAPLSEKENIPVTNEYLFIPIAYEIEHVLTEDQYLAIQANRKLAIGISQTDSNPKAFFIKLLEWERDGDGDSGNLHLIAWPKEPFNIEVIEGTPDHETNNAGTRVFDISFSPEFE